MYFYASEDGGHFLYNSITVPRKCILKILMDF